MTATDNYKEICKGNETYFMERYAEKPNFVWFWRYGYICNGNRVLLKDGLRTRPRIK